MDGMIRRAAAVTLEYAGDGGGGEKRIFGDLPSAPSRRRRGGDTRPLLLRGGAQVYWNPHPGAHPVATGPERQLASPRRRITRLLVPMVYIRRNIFTKIIDYLDVIPSRLS